MIRFVKGVIKWVIVVLVVMTASMAIIHVDEKCREMTSFGGDIQTSVEVAIEKTGIFH